MVENEQQGMKQRNTSQKNAEEKKGILRSLSFQVLPLLSI